MSDVIPGELVHIADDEYTSFVKREPVVLAHLIAGPVAGLVTLFAPGAPSSTAEQITAGAVALGLVLQGFLVRRFVAPEWKRVTGSPLPGVIFPGRISAGSLVSVNSGVVVAHPSPQPHD